MSLIKNELKTPQSNLSRPPKMTMRPDPTGKFAERAELKMKTWLHIVARQG